ncbi:MAG: Wzz/FepE/Etk N-terminal domain-containing protein [Bacillus sp. (in: firmicutes)]
MDETISIKDFFQTIKKRVLLIISIMLICALATGFISYKYLTPKYQASTQLLINDSTGKKAITTKKKKDDQEEVNNYTSSQLQTNLQLVNTYIAIMKSPAILEKVISELNLQKSVGELNGMFEVESEEESQVIDITVTDKNQENAVIIANEIAKVFKKEVLKIMKIDNVEILAKAKYLPNQAPINSQPIQNIIISLLVGMVIGIGLTLILDYFDGTVHTKQDIEASLQIPILGVVPPIKSRKKIFKENKIKTEYRGETLGS